MDEKKPASTSRSAALMQAARDAQGFSGDMQDSPLDLGASNEAPPAYGELHDQLNLSQPGFNAGAAVTDDGRVNITIRQTNRQLADILAPALRGHLLPPEKPSTGPLPPAYIPPSLGGVPGQTPPPKLNVVVQIVGSRGDVQPFVALGKVLKETYGHRVRIATHPTFQKFVEENDLEFFSIGGDPAELMAFMVKNPGLMPGIDALKSGEVAKRRKGIEQIVLGCWRSCIEAGDGLGPPPETTQSGDQPLDDGDLSLPGDPNSRPFVADAIIANPPSFAHIHIAEKMGIPLHVMFTMPWSPTRAFPHPLANIQSSNTDVVLTNYISYALVEMMTWQGLGDVINRFRTKVLDLEPLSLIWAPGLLTRLHIPTTYCWSPALIPKPNDWGREVSIPGFYFLDLATSYTPEPDLAAFLDNGPPPVYIGFGSIVVDDPNQLTRMIFDAVTLSGVRALVSQGWGGLGADSVGIPEGVFMLGNCPHDWLFKKVSCVVHHGGAGTTAAGIKTGTPTVIVPFFGDQPFWGSMIAKAGAGPAPIPYKKLTAESLAEAITTALRPETQARAKELGEKIRQEKGTDLGAKNFHDFLDYDKMRCSVAPSRTAVWRVRRTEVKLSALAAAVLVKRRVLQYADLKLYRAQEYDTEEQPWDPISAVTSALVGDMSSMAMAIGDIPKEWYKVAKKSSNSAPGPKEETPANEAASETTQETLPSLTSDTTSTSKQPATTLTPSASSESGSALPASSSAQSQSTKRPDNKRSGSSQGINVEAALGASLETGKGVGRFVETGVKTPMNFCMGLAKGFRNAPRLYNDDTVRKQEKVTGLASGVILAGKEFGFGLFDGITGMVTQPMRGAEKEGVQGLIKGFGKGIGGLVLKPAAGFWAIPAYTMKGLHAEVRSKFHRSVESYIQVSRVLQGQADLSSASHQEQEDIIARFNSKRAEMKGFQSWKSQEKQAASSSPGEGTAAASQERELALGDQPPKTGFWNTRHLSLEERRKLHAVKDAWKKKNMAEAAGAALSLGSGNASGSGTNPSQQASTAASPPSPDLGFEDEEMESAIRASVAQTSRGDDAEDARIEEQMRSSVREIRRLARENRARAQENRGSEQRIEMRDWKEAPTDLSTRGEKDGARSVEDNITDEEFERLVAEAVRQSMLSQGGGAAGTDAHALGGTVGTGQGEADEELRRALEESRRAAAAQGGGGGSGTRHDEEELKRALEESRRAAAAAAAATQGSGGSAGHDEEELKKALEESERAHREHIARTSTERSEEEIILEYVKKQSLAEEAFRRQQQLKGTGAGGEKGHEDQGDEDEELRRAMEESLKVSGREGGPSGSR